MYNIRRYDKYIYIGNKISETLTHGVNAEEQHEQRVEHQAGQKELADAFPLEVQEGLAKGVLQDVPPPHLHEGQQQAALAAGSPCHSAQPVCINSNANSHNLFTLVLL